MESDRMDPFEKLSSHIEAVRDVVAEDVGKGDSFLFVIEFYNNLRYAHQYR